MTKREKYYHWKNSKNGKNVIDFHSRIWRSFAIIGAAATHVGLDKNGDVIARVLPVDECLELLKKKHMGETIPEEYSLFEGDGDLTYGHETEFCVTYEEPTTPT